MFTRAPFGLTNIPDHFQQAMDTILATEGLEEFATCYDDDIRILRYSRRTPKSRVHSFTSTRQEPLVGAPRQIILWCTSHRVLEIHGERCRDHPHGGKNSRHKRPQVTYISASSTVTAWVSELL
jgi:hypothetical protein